MQFPVDTFFLYDSKTQIQTTFVFFLDAALRSAHQFYLSVSTTSMLSLPAQWLVEN